MKRATCRYDVATPARPAPWGWRARQAFDFAAMVLLAPFRIVAAVWRFFVRVGQGFFDGLFTAFFGLVGLGIIAFVTFGVLRVALHPLFR